MASKTNRTITVLFFIAILFLFLNKYSYAQKIAHNLANNIETFSEETPSEKCLGNLNTSDGAQWQALFRCDLANPVMIFSNDYSSQNGTPEQIAHNFLVSNMDLFRIRGIETDLKDPIRRLSPGSTHIIYEQKFGERPIFDSSITVHVNNSGSIELVTSNFKDVSYLSDTDSSLDISEAIAIEIASSNLRGAKGSGTIKAKKGFLQTQNGLQKIWRIEYPTKEPPGYWVLDIDIKSGKVYKRVNTLKFINARGFIHAINPAISNEVSEVTLKNLKNPTDGSKYSLNGIFIEVLNSRFGSIWEDNPVFDYEYVFDEQTKNEAKESNPHYEEVMVYNYMEGYRSYIQSLGFHLFSSYKLKADAHGTSQDSSWYDSANKTIVYGDGGPNDASDADIILHELGHAAYDFIRPTHIHMTGETAAMHEGFSDFQAASYNGDPCIGEWDSKFYSQTGCLRNLENDKNYKSDLTGREHDDGEIWGASLWDLRKLLSLAEGDDAISIADSLVMKSLYYLADENVTFKEGALAIMLADSNLYHGKHSALIENVFTSRGILDNDVASK